MYSKQFLTDIYRTLYLIREFETRGVALSRTGQIRGYFHPYLGEEAIAAGVCAALEKRDYVTSTHRGHGHCIARGTHIDRMFAELLGRKTGYCMGLGGSMHIADFEDGVIGANGIVGGGMSIGTGAALGAVIRGEDRVTVVFASDGATNNGVFGESMNLAALWNLPVIYVIENNQYAVSTPIEQSTREPEIYRRSIGYGVESGRVDGNDVLAVYERTRDAVSLCREGKGPYLLEAVTYRHGGHHVNDPGLYMPKETLAEYLKNDPVERGRNVLIESGEMSEEEIAAIEAEIDRQIDDAVEFALASPEMTSGEFTSMMEGF